MNKILVAITCLVLINCNSQNIDMEEIYELELDLVSNYKEQPVYSCQVDKNNCRLYIEIIGSNDYQFVENNGESMLLPLNPMIIASGEQTVKVRVYPFEGEQYIKDAFIKLSINYAPDKDSNLSDYQEIASYTLPENLAEQKLPYFEDTFTFEAKVPYDYSQELANAYNLEELPNIEEKVVEKYNQLRDICIKQDKIAYHKACIHSSGIVSNTMYQTTKKEIIDSYNTSFALVQDDPRIKEREILPIENYIMRFYANGKIVALWQHNLEPMLYIKAKYANTEGELVEFKGGTPKYLYWPKGSKELKVW